MGFEKVLTKCLNSQGNIYRLRLKYPWQWQGKDLDEDSWKVQKQIDEDYARRTIKA